MKEISGSSTVDRLRSVLDEVIVGRFRVPVLGRECVVTRICHDLNELLQLEQLDGYTLFLRSAGLGKNGLTITDAILETTISDSFTPAIVLELLAPALDVAMARFGEVKDRFVPEDGSHPSRARICEWLVSRVTAIVDLLHLPIALTGEACFTEPTLVVFERVAQQSAEELYSCLGLGYSTFLAEKTGTEYLSESLLLAGNDKHAIQSAFLGVLRDYLEEVANRASIDARGLNWTKELKRHWEAVICQHLGRS